MNMCDKEQLVGYLYDELAPAERADFEAHVAACTECRGELGALRRTRQHFGRWTPPQPEFNFHIVGGPAPPPRRFAAAAPRWALATAASVLLLAGAAAIAHLEIGYGPEGVVVRTGWGRPASGPAAPAPAVPATAPVLAQAVPAAASSERLAAQVEALARRLRELEEAQTTQLAKVAGTVRPGITAPELRRILAETESRQRTEMALQVAQIWKDFNAARASDLARVQDVVGRVQGLTNQQLRQHRDSIESLYRVSASQR